MYDQCANMYVKRLTSGSGASAGKGFMPFLKQCSTYFPSGGGISNRWCLPKRLGHFLWKGIKPFPALGTLLAKAPLEVCRSLRPWRLGEKKYLARNEALACCLSSRKGAENTKKCTTNLVVS